VFISVTTLFEDGKRRSAYAIKTQVPKVGWLHYEVNDAKVRAYLRREDGTELLCLEHARLVACRGTQGALIEGIEYRKKGVKHSISDRQAWWCEAPPRSRPLFDHQAYILSREREWQRQIDAGWGSN
jgi:hypothetical protein